MAILPYGSGRPIPLPVPQGGTGAITLTGIVKGNGTSALTAATSGSDYSAGTASLATGILKSTTTTGALSIAVAGDFPTLNQNTSGNAATVTTNANLTGPITSVGNATSIASQTGTGSKFVVDTSPTLITPVIGAATGTSLVLTNTSATGLAVGANGSTNPTLQVDSSTASVATGLLVKGAAAAGGLALSVITSGTNENLKLDAAGSGTISIGSVSTGAITLTRATNLSSTLTVTSTAVILSGTSPAAGGTVAARFGSSGGAGPQLVVGSGAPTVAAAKGSIYLRTDGSATNNRAYINTDGSTTWTAITTVA